MSENSFPRRPSPDAVHGFSWRISRLPGLVLLTVSACQTPRPAEPPPSRPLGRDESPVSAPARAPEPDRHASPFEELRGELTLRDALSLALARSPELAAFSWRIREAEARALQAGLLPNPQLEGEVENFGGTGDFDGFDASESTIALSQLIQLGGKRARRLRVEELGGALAAWDYEASRLSVVTATTRAFVGVLAGQERLRVAEGSLDLAEEVLRSASERVQAGKSSPLEETRARVVVANGRIVVERARRGLGAARARLASSWGSTTPRFEAARGDLESIPAPPAFEDVARWVAENPEVARWVVEITERQARVDLAKSQAVSDVTVRGGVRLLEGDDDTAFVMGIALPLPLFDRNQGRIHEARFDEAEARERQRAAEVRVMTRLVEAYESLRSSHFAATSLQTEVMPAAAGAFASAREAFSEGKLGYLDVADAERTIFEVRDEYIEALAAYHEARATVEGLVGRSLESVAPGSEQMNRE